MTDGEIICAIDVWATRHAAPLVRVDSSNADLDGLAAWAVANAMLDIQREHPGVEEPPAMMSMVNGNLHHTLYCLLVEAGLETVTV